MDEITKELVECLKEAFLYGWHPNLPEGMHLRWLKTLEKASVIPPCGNDETLKKGDKEIP